MRRDFDEFQFQARNAFKTFATLSEVKQRDTIVANEATDYCDTNKEQISKLFQRMDDLDKQVAFVKDMNKTFAKVNTVFTDQVNTLTVENAQHRDKMRMMVEDCIERSENHTELLQKRCDEMGKQADGLRHIIKNHQQDRQEMRNLVGEAQAKADNLALKCEEVLRQGNQLLRVETETKMCKFTENLILEFKHLN